MRTTVAVYALPGCSLKLELRLEPRLGGRRIGLRHLHVDAQLVRIGQPEQFGARALTRVDQRADVGIASGDDAVERRHDPLERFQIAQARYVGGGGIGGRFFRRRIARFFIRILLRDRFGLQQLLPAGVGGLRQRLVGARRARDPQPPG